MDGCDIVMGIVNIIPRLPPEKFSERDPSKDFEQLAQALEKKSLLIESPAIGSESSVWYNEQGGAKLLSMLFSSRKSSTCRLPREEQRCRPGQTR
jgi:hypothetical protein